MALIIITAKVINMAMLALCRRKLNLWVAPFSQLQFGLGILLRRLFSDASKWSLPRGGSNQSLTAAPNRSERGSGWWLFEVATCS